MICTPRRISRNRCLFPEHVNAGRVFSRADHETELAPPLISIKVGKSQEGGEQASDPSECLQLKVQGKETDINSLLLADCIQAEVQIGVWKPLFSCKFDHSSHFTLLDLQTAYRTVILLRIGESPNSLAVYSLLIFRSDITVTLISHLSLLKQRRGFQAHSDFCI